MQNEWDETKNVLKVVFFHEFSGRSRETGPRKG